MAAALETATANAAEQGYAYPRLGVEAAGGCAWRGWKAGLAQACRFGKAASEQRAAASIGEAGATGLVGQNNGVPTAPAAVSVILREGNRLVREWNGATHTVLVLADGFEWQGRLYRSLSEIAEAITGAHWSGPRFFGLVKRKPERREPTAIPGSTDQPVPDANAGLAARSAP
jgi:Protein of unknown function (DUF2924)